MLRELPADFSSTVDSEAASVLLQTARLDPFHHKSYLFHDCSEVLVACSFGDVSAVFAGIEAALRDGYYVAGFLSYECGAHFEPRVAVNVPGAVAGGLPLAWFGVYESPKVFDHSADEGDLPNTQFSPPAPVANKNPLADLGELPLDISASAYRERIERIKRYIEAGDTYQVNFTTRVRIPYQARATAFFSALLRNQPVAYGALLNLGDIQIVSASPELFFQVQGDRITTRPMKGTAARGKDLDEDAAIAAWLECDEKNRSENVMIVDLLRNDLGRICVPGSILVEKLFAVERYRPLFQMTSTVSGQLRAEVDFYEIFKALFPCGSVVGTPKVRTMQIIHELEGSATEPRSRGIYTGAIGFISPRREAVFSVAIRTLVLRDGTAEMGVGSGIVYDSDADAEYEECRLKAAFLIRSPVEFQLIETMLWDGDYFLLQSHLERLASSAAYFDFRFDREEVLSGLLDLRHGFATGQRHRVRLQLEESGAVQFSSSPIPATPESSSGMLSALMAEERVFSGDFYLRHKTTNRGLYERTYARASELGFDDALFLNERGEVAEGAIHNIFVEKDGQLLTPPLAAGVLPGVFRRHLLETRSTAAERRLTLDDFRAADRVFLCNSVRGLREVGSIRKSEEVLFARRSVTVVPVV